MNPAVSLSLSLSQSASFIRLYVRVSIHLLKDHARASCDALSVSAAP
jgi:hypothetical protein